jgi:hypothetical protein
MNASTAYKFYHAYKLFYGGKYDPTKYNWNLPNLPDLERQSDRHFYRRLTDKLTDADIHGLYTVGFFHKTSAYIADLVTPEWMSQGIRFASRGQNGAPQLEADLYELGKTLQDVDIDTWLYGTIIDGRREAIPPCIQMVVSRELDIDVAALLLMIPQPGRNYNWFATMSAQPVEQAFGPLAFTKKLHTADRLIRFNRPGWRLMSQEIAAAFWNAAGIDDLSPRVFTKAPSLF